MEEQECCSNYVTTHLPQSSCCSTIMTAMTHDSLSIESGMCGMSILYSCPYLSMCYQLTYGGTVQKLLHFHIYCLFHCTAKSNPFYRSTLHPDALTIYILYESTYTKFGVPVQYVSALLLTCLKALQHRC